MTSSVKATVQTSLQVQELIALGINAATNPTIPYGIPGSPFNYTATTTIVGSKCWGNTIALVAGVATIDLTALTRSGLPTVDLTGLRIIAMHIHAVATNTNPLTVMTGAANGYTGLFDATSHGDSIPPDGSVLIHHPSGGTIVGGSLKTIDLASAMTTAQFDIVILAGP